MDRARTGRDGERSRCGVRAPGWGHEFEEGTACRRARDGGLLEGKAAGESVGRPSGQQGQISRLTRELEVTRSKLARTQIALDIMGKAHELLEEISRSEQAGPDEPRRGRV